MASIKSPTKLAVFDFDGTLFRSPLPPVGWEGSWWGNTLSLAPPYVPLEPTLDWWNGNVVERAKSACANEDTVTALVTGREASKFSLRVPELIAQMGLKFDHVEMSPGISTEPFKVGVIDALLAKYPSVRGVDLWEDNEPHLRKFVDHVEMSGRAAFSHLITVPRHEVGTPSPVVVASRYLGK